MVKFGCALELKDTFVITNCLLVHARGRCQRARQRNVNQPQNSGELIKLRARSETRWSCGYDDHTLDVAVHLRRGDLCVALNLGFYRKL